MQYKNLCLDFVIELGQLGTTQKIITAFENVPKDVICYFTCQIVEALAYLQTKTIIHCDVKPENIFLMSDFQLKLGDFGSARKIDDQFITQYSNSKPYLNGTIEYMSPASLSGKEVDYS